MPSHSEHAKLLAQRALATSDAAHSKELFTHARELQAQGPEILGLNPLIEKFNDNQIAKALAGVRSYCNVLSYLGIGNHIDGMWLDTLR